LSAWLKRYMLGDPFARPKKDLKAQAALAREAHKKRKRGEKDA